MNEKQLELYKDCIAKQLEEIDLLSSIYCNPGEIVIFDPGAISEFNEFVASSKFFSVNLSTRLEFGVSIPIMTTESTKENVQICFNLPHLYPLMENAIVTIPSIQNTNERTLIMDRIELYLETIDKNEPYIFQLLSWLQDQLEEILKKNPNEVNDSPAPIKEKVADFERLWIYSHHIKSKIKRKEIVRQSRDLNLTGFCRPGKPGIICVEGLMENTQEFWKCIKSMSWQKISLRKSEKRQKTVEDFDKLRRFPDFQEKLFTNSEENEEESVMNMGAFIKFLEVHNSGYMKKELFGFD